MKFFLVLFSMLILNVSCAQMSSKPITEVSQNEINSVILVDVRTPAEYASGHLDNAENINWFDENFDKRFEAINKNETIYLYCKKGGRSLKAQQRLMSLGFTQVVNLEGGYDAYLENQ